jgi:hypothetical protein
MILFKMITCLIIDYSVAADYCSGFGFECSKTNNLVAMAFILRKSGHPVPDIGSSISFGPYTIILNFNLALNRFIVIVGLDRSISLKAAAANIGFQAHSHSDRRKQTTVTLPAVAVSSRMSSSNCWYR